MCEKTTPTSSAAGSVNAHPSNDDNSNNDNTNDSSNNSNNHTVLLDSLSSHGGMKRRRTKQHSNSTPVLPTHLTSANIGTNALGSPNNSNNNNNNNNHSRGHTGFVASSLALGVSLTSSSSSTSISSSATPGASSLTTGSTLAPTAPSTSSISFGQSVYGYGTTSTNNSTTNNSCSTSHHHHPEPPPSFRSMLVAMKNILFLYLKHHSPSLRSALCKIRTVLLWTILLAFGIVILLFLVLLRGFYHDAVRVCTPRANVVMPGRLPLVEYYIHGRGNGHYARSMAVIEALNQDGVDVRMFVGRATIWNFFREQQQGEGDSSTATTIPATNADPNKHIGTTTAISVNTILPKYSFFHTLSLIMERIMGDCEVGLQTQRYPMLVITDGDMPGMLRAKLGGIPSVGISHGQIFSICKKPNYIRADPHLDRAWNQQGWINKIAAYYTSWQIGTDFLEMETKSNSAVVARPPLRPEVVKMVQMRRTRDFAGLDERISNWLLYEADEGPMEELLLLQEQQQQQGTTTNNNTTASTTDVTAAANAAIADRLAALPRRKLVVCYFRDRNGERVIQTLLDAGVDVVLFESGYNKALEGKTTNANVYGTDWVVDEQDRIEVRRQAGLEPNLVVTESSKHTSTVESSSSSSNKNNKQKKIPLYSRQRRRRLDTSAHSHPRPSTSPRLIRITERNLFVPFMAVADGIAASAGSQLLSECMYAKLPLLAFYRSDDNEQTLNVELARKERTNRPNVPIFGMSLESLRPSSLLAQTEMESFLEKVQNSTVTEGYYQHLEDKTKGTTTGTASGSTTGTTSGAPAAAVAPVADTVTVPVQTEEPDPFHGMQDAAAIVLEIVRKVRNVEETE